MAHVLVNEVSWSRKRSGMLAGCLRRYFYQYYLTWDGWNPEAPSERRLAYRLGKMTTLPRLAGIAAHETIRRMLWSAKTRRPLTQTSQELAAAMMKQIWLDAREGRWAENPKAFPPVLELYYLGGVPREEIIRFGAIARNAVRAFEGSQLFERLKATDPSSWLACDEPIRPGDAPACLVDGAKVWCRPDFAIRDGDRLVIYDWKTGQRRDEDRVQLHAYALHGSQVWGFAPEKISCIAVYLSEPVEEVPYAITREGLEEVVEIIRADLTRFRALDARKDDAEAFPVDPKPAVCAWCEFQEICPAVKRAPAHATAAPAPAPSGPAEEETA